MMNSRTSLGMSIGDWNAYVDARYQERMWSDRCITCYRIYTTGDGTFAICVGEPTLVGLVPTNNLVDAFLGVPFSDAQTLSTFTPPQGAIGAPETNTAIVVRRRRMF